MGSHGTIPHFPDEMRTVDPAASILVSDDSCQWVRSRMGIVGLIALEERVSPETLREWLDQMIIRAHAQLDALPESLFSHDDMWNVTLFIAVPWTQGEISADSKLSTALLDVTRDLSGSRKVILWTDTSVANHLGPLAQASKTWSGSSGEPLRDVVQASARDEFERGALEVLFQRRITEADWDTLIRALGRALS
jgi:hypothetical protein